MPDPDIAARFLHAPVELDPGRPMQRLAIARVALEMVEAAPILHDGLAQPVVAEKADLGRSGLQFLQHFRHHASNRQPLVQFPWFVDAHADQEDDKVAVDSARDTACDDVGHEVFPINGPRERKRAQRVQNGDERDKPGP